MKAPTLALLLALGLAAPGVRADDAADTALHQQITDLQRRAEQALAGASGTALYRPAKALAWLDLALHELYEEDRAGIIEHSVAEAERLLAPGTPEAGFDTPHDRSSERIRADLWTRAAEMRASRQFACAAREIAQLEVQLVWAGHEKWESGWAHARPAMEVAENLAYEAEMAQRACNATAAPNVEKISIAGDALFPLDKDDVRHMTAAGRERLATFAGDLKQWKSIERIVVIGHTDRLGASAYNDGLSRRRAENIRAYLIRSGLPAERIVAAGHGGRSPLVQCADRADRRKLVDCLQANRRVEIMVSGER
jgi:outer membrane protein OmpA-like peptidoglycan-associated protein